MKRLQGGLGQPARPDPEDEDRERARELQKRLNIVGDDSYWLRGEFAPNFKFNGRDPVLGPFVALAAGDRKYFADIIEGRRTGYNSVVLAFFKARLDGEGGTTAGSVGTGGTSPNAPKTVGEGLESLVMKGRAGVKKATRLGTVCLRRSGVAS